MDLFVGNHDVSPTEGVTYESPLAAEPHDNRYLAKKHSQSKKIISLDLPITK